MKNELTLYDYIAVAALLKWAKQNKIEIEVKRMGNDVAGVYWKVKLKNKKLNKNLYGKNRKPRIK